ncbi:MAG: GntR family transcriptional regulator [Hyphomicrobiaceae bacterium]
MNALSRKKNDDFVSLYWTDDPALPKYERLRAAFVKAITEGFWAPGMRLPTEAELVETTPCSLGTIQRALRSLTEDGVIARKRGSGSVVPDLSGRISDPLHMRFLKPGEENGYQVVETKVVDRKILKSNGPWSEALNLDGKPLIKIVRIFTINAQTHVYNEFYAKSSRFPELVNLPKSELNGLNFKKLITKDYQSPIHRVRHRLRFEVLKKSVLKYGNYIEDVPSPILNVVAFAINGDPIYYQDYYLPAEKGVLDLGLTSFA